MDLFNLDMAEYFSFLLTFMRLSLVVFLLPVFGGDSAPTQVKAAMCLVLTMALFPYIGIKGVQYPSHPFDLALIALGEVILGLTMGLAVRFIFAGIQTGGQLLGFQMGFTMINIADPISGASVSITSYFLYLVTLLTFLSLNGHLFMLKALVESFSLIPPGQIVLSDMLTSKILEMSATMFSLAVRIAAPVLAALFLVELALALMGRAAPQMNLLMLGFPLKIAVGFFFLGMLFTVLSSRVAEFITELAPMYNILFKVASPL